MKREICAGILIPKQYSEHNSEIGDIPKTKVRLDVIALGALHGDTRASATASVATNSVRISTFTLPQLIVAPPTLLSANSCYIQISRGNYYWNVGETLTVGYDSGFLELTHDDILGAMQCATATYSSSEHQKGRP